jgi:NhaA family Na+:H+ antiporter
MFRRVKKIFELEAITGILLLTATFLAIFLTNSKNYYFYQNFFSLSLPLNLGFIGVVKEMTILDYINDALMTLFFLLIGLELKEEILIGELSNRSRATLPAIAACGGVIFPALIFYFFNFDHKNNLSGLAIPTATDIAFAYGIICLFGKKIPKSLKVFLVSLAIFDDIIAIVLIAIFYSNKIEIIYLSMSCCCIFLLAILNFKNHFKIFSYLVIGLVFWLMVLKSGIHPTIAGVIFAIFIPRQKNMLHKLIKKIAPIVNFLILPIFAFANSGVKINFLSITDFTNPITLGVLFGLFFGKQIGVMLFSFIAIKLRFTNLPRSSGGEVSWLDFYGVALLTGIGFTMSFFIGSLAFKNQEMFNQVKIGVLSGSLLSAILGIFIIFISTKLKKHLI